MQTNRKEFLKTAGSFTLFSAMGLNFISCNTTSSSDDEEGEIIQNGNVISFDITTTFQELRNEGGMVLSTSGGFLAVNVDGETIRAFSNVCTHASCTTDWSLPGDQFICTCHNSIFNLSGERISGPAARDLPEFGVSRSENMVTITK